MSRIYLGIGSNLGDKEWARSSSNRLSAKPCHGDFILTTSSSMLLPVWKQTSPLCRC